LESLLADFAIVAITMNFKWNHE